jgi:alpha-tubulin suppressor-like RCC1 family protein
MMMVARLNQTCGIYDDGLECWGWNAYGQLGNGTYTNTNEYSITQVVGLTSGVQQVALGDFHACALVNGAVKCWGRNNHGQLGIGLSGDTSNVPLPVIGLPDGIAQIAAGTEHSCAITAQGEAWCWGNNDHGQLGDGATTDHAAPAPVMGLGGRALSMAAGKEHTCALLEDGKVKCWGGGERGQLGNGAWADSLAPVLVQLPAGFRVAQIASGGSHMCARSLGGNVSCWGWNYAGQLGNGTFDDANTPIPVYGMATNIDLPRRLYLPLAFHSRP